ncbi:MAG TPA: polysaccharide deacetylase family protein [Burkholderiaceae bacterium]|jgi:peptidoglycan/xylan/chitin deacetylase (PgdA/CDA1 family)
MDRTSSILSLNVTGNPTRAAKADRGQALAHRFKTFVKRLAYRTGGLDICHRLRNRHTLTVVMFHRVLPRSDLRWKGADPEWTMSTDAFSACLHFFKKHYHPISLAQLAAAQAGESTLPPRSLLITFDDGWADTSEFAQPILDGLGLQALIFIAGSVIDQAAPFWQESVYRTLSASTDGMSRLNSAMARCHIDARLTQREARDEQSIRSVIRALETVELARLNELARVLQTDSNESAAMMTASQLRKMADCRHAIGSHGMTHQPLTKVENPTEEVTQAKQALMSHLNEFPIDSMSFPHGAYDSKVVASCRAMGYRHLFSSDAFLNKFDNADKNGRIWGRIHISERAIADAQGRFHPFMLATSLFLRPRTMLAG